MRNGIARLAVAVFALGATIVPTGSAFAHGSCNVYADNPFETYYNGEYVVAAAGELYCSDVHDPATYNLNICLYYHPATLPPSDISVAGLPPLARPVVCGFASIHHDHGTYGAVYAPCPYLPGYYQTYVFNGRAGTHAGIVDKYDYSAWVFVDGTACL